MSRTPSLPLGHALSQADCLSPCRGTVGHGSHWPHHFLRGLPWSTASSGRKCGLREGELIKGAGAGCRATQKLFIGRLWEQPPRVAAADGHGECSEAAPSACRREARSQPRRGRASARAREPVAWEGPAAAALTRVRALEAICPLSAPGSGRGLGSTLKLPESTLPRFRNHEGLGR